MIPANTDIRRRETFQNVKRDMYVFLEEGETNESLGLLIEFDYGDELSNGSYKTRRAEIEYDLMNKHNVDISKATFQQVQEAIENVFGEDKKEGF